MSQLTQLEAAAESLSAEDKRALVAFLLEKLRQDSDSAAPPRRGESIRDIEPVSVGKILRPLSPDDDLLGEMLEGRPRFTASTRVFSSP